MTEKKLHGKGQFSGTQRQDHKPTSLQCYDLRVDSFVNCFLKTLANTGTIEERVIYFRFKARDMRKLKAINADYCTIQIELKQYLIKYVAKETGDQRLVINPNTAMGREIFRMLQHPPPGWRCPDVPIERRLTLAIARHYINEGRHGQYINEYDMIKIAQGIEMHFWNHLCSWSQERRMFSSEKIRHSMMKFRDAFGITDDDYHFESMERRFKRWVAHRNLRLSAEISI